MANNNWDKTTPKEEKTKVEKYSGFYIGRYEAGASKLEDVKKNNLYDIAGNLWEWTTESTQVDGQSGTFNVLRGGSFSNSYAGSPACYRRYNYVTGTITNGGFRPALYVK